MSNIEAAVEHAVGEYAAAMHHADGDRLRRVCHPSMVMFGHWEGDLGGPTGIDALVVEIAVDPSDAGSGRTFEFAIDTLQVTNKRSAVVRVRTFVQGVWYTDHLLLANCEGRWLIIAKLFDPDDATV